MPTLRRSWTLGFQQIIFKRDIKSGETAHPFFLGASALSDPFTRRAAVDLFRALRNGASPGDLSSPEVLQLVMRVIQQAISIGDLVSVRRQGTSSAVTQNSGGGPGSGAQPPLRRRATTTSPPPDNRKEKTWIEIRLVDQDGNPVSGGKYKLKITDGSVREGSLDDDGRVKVSGIDPGTCTLWFPEFDGREWTPK